jgi:hypothetical protein
MPSNLNQNQNEEAAVSAIDLGNVDFLKLLLAMINTPMGESDSFPGEEDMGARTVLVGPPGGAKTSFIKQVGRMMGVTTYCLKPGARGQGAYGVIPVPVQRTPGDDNSWVLVYPKPDWVEMFGDDAGILFVDEINTAGRNLQAPQLGLLQEKEIGAHHFGPRVRVLGAMNAVEEAGGGHDLSAAVANRICHLPWPDPSIEAHNEYMITLGMARVDREASIDLAKEEERVMQEFYGGAFAQSVGLFAGFSTSFREWHRNQPKAGDPRSSGAWLSLRTKEYAARAHAAAKIHKLNDDERDLYMSGWVGEAFVAEFTEWERKQDVPDAALFLDGKKDFEHSRFRIDRTAALLSSCAALIAPKDCKNRNNRAKTLWQFLDAVAGDALDSVAQVVIGSLYKANLATLPAAKPVLKKLRPMLDATEGKAV